MASVQLAAPRRALLSHRISVPAFLIALIAVSAVLRTRQLNGGFWIDEGLSVGIAHHHWSSIPGLLTQDGSPPGYYLLLGLWIRLFGDGERATHMLSLLFGLACIPLAYAAARAIFDRRTGFVCATLAAFDPFLTYYAQETRMYEVEALLSIVVAYAYVQGVLRGRASWTVALAPALAAMLYLHNWALFLCGGLAAATVICARRRLKRFGLVALGVVAAVPALGADLCSNRCGTPAPRGRRRPAFAIWCSRPARSSTATQRSSRSCSSAAPACSRSRRAGTTMSA